MIDWHCHILPNMDDGSRDVAESISLINMQREQGIGTIVATPHFYANDESCEDFLLRRQRSFELLKNQLPDECPRILLGAEVRYYQGISRLSNLKDLRVENSKILLLEMPDTKWTESMVRELVEISSFGGIRLVLAHVERYMPIQDAKIRRRLLESGILMQVNASFFTEFFTRHKALSHLKNGHIHFLGSDCHNTTSRPPNIGKAYEIICKKQGEIYLSQMNDFGHSKLFTV